VWPKSNIAEVAMLVDNFQITSEALGSKIGNLAQRLSLAADAAKMGVWDYYIPENKLIWDKWMYALYGIREEDFLGAYQAWQNGLHPDDKVRGDMEIDQAIQGEKEFDTEFRVIWPSGEIRYIKANALVIRDLDGMALRMIGINYDITARKQAEKKLDEYRNSLEQKVRLRTKELEKVHKALVDKALEAGRSQLSAMVLHNIGNAVTPISVYVRNLQNSEMKELNQYLQSCYQELLKHKHNFTEYLVQDIRGADVLELMGELITSLADGQKQALDIIGKIISGIDHISEILTLQRSYAPGKARIKESVNLTSLANDALKMQEGALEKRNIAIKSSFFHPIPALKIEKSKLMQVIVNLIKNSCDAIQESGSDRQHTIIVETWHRDAKIGFRIEDTGIGIEKDRFKEIFKFGVSSKGSSGFGLYYCKSFVETNNGKIYLESPGMGKGTTFAIEFSLPD
jgi:PAS domain S-box-containing protein